MEGWGWGKGNRGGRAGNRKKKVPGAELPRLDLGDLGRGSVGPKSWRRGAVSPHLEHRCLIGAPSCISAFPRITFLPSHLVLEEGRGSGTEKPRFRGLGEEAATHLEAVVAATRVPSSWPCWAANRGEDDQRQSPSQTGASFPAPLSHNEMETQVSALTRSSGGRSLCIRNDSPPPMSPHPGCAFTQIWEPLSPAPECA